MTLIKSISGIRGTIGGEEGNALTPIGYCAVLRLHMLALYKIKKLEAPRL